MSLVKRNWLAQGPRIATAFLFFITIEIANADTIETVVGGSNGDGQTADIAAIIPQHMVYDASGNLYVADSSNNRIRRIENGTNIISTVAGTGQYGSSGDGGLATQAQLASPTGVTIDPSGNIYFSDNLNHRVRRIDAATRIITTVAGTGTAGFNGDGAGPSAQLNFPAGVTWTSQGLLIADAANHRVRRLSGGTLTTIVGSGTMGWAGDGGQATAARIANPTHAVVDSAGNMYVADKSNCRIRKVTPGGIISTFGGLDVSSASACGRTGDNGLATQAKLNQPGFLAIDPQQQYLYSVETGSYTIRRINFSTNIISHVAGTGFPGSNGDGGPAATAQFASPTAIVFNSSSNLLVADTSLRTIRRIDSSGNINSIVGHGTGDGYNAQYMRISPRGLKWDTAGNLYIADSSARIRKINTSNVGSTFAGTGVYGFTGDNGPAINANLQYPIDVVIDPTGRICFSDNLGHRIRCINTSTGVITTLAGDGVGRFNGDGSATTSSFNFPSALVFDPSDNSILVADSSNHRVRRIKNGTVTTVVGTGAFVFNGDGMAPLSTNINTPTGLALDSAGNLYIAEKSGAAIRKWNVATNTMITVGGTRVVGSTGDGGPAIQAKINQPEHLALRSDGILFLTEGFTPRVRKIDLSTGIISRVAGTGIPGVSGDGGDALLAQFMKAGGLTLSPDGAYLYLTDMDGDNVRRISLGTPPPTTTTTTTTTTSTTTTTIQRPAAPGNLAIMP